MQHPMGQRASLRRLLSPRVGLLQGTTAGGGPGGNPASVGGGKRWVLWLAVTAAVLSVVAAVGIYESLGEEDDLAAYDRPVLDFFALHRLSWLTPAVAAFTRIGSAPVLSVILLLLVGILCWRRRSLYPLLLLAGAAAASVLLTVALKNALDRPRPPYELAVPPFETSGSFPSGHTLNSTALALVLCYLMLRFSRPRPLKLVAIGVALIYIAAMGVSRLYLGAHWLTDVVSGWALGLLVAALAVVVDRLLLWRAPAVIVAPPAPGTGGESPGGDPVSA
ncbi:phosphatase PAP2 family protein [Galactobacter valiniphilus]|nr:phosphatase PAP2 family protein [Galactobacter valiniphilus]